jgi:single-strand DNA-binding protein
VNDVRLLGRVTSVPVVVDLPSGDALVSFRVSVPRSPGSRSGGASAGQRVDSIPCSAWSATLRRRIAGWRPGDTVEVSGAVCCRFYQAGGATRSRVEVVVSSAKIIRRSRAA